jgi:hypothetical protein
MTIIAHFVGQCKWIVILINLWGRDFLFTDPGKFVIIKREGGEFWIQNSPVLPDFWAHQRDLGDFQ